MTKPYIGYGDYFPTPAYWQHPTITDDLYHWPTKSVIYPENDHEWDFHFSSSILNTLVADWSVEMNHCYPAWVDQKKGFWYYDDNGEIVAKEGFNRALVRMAKLRDDGVLNLTTIKEFLNLQIALEHISYQLQPDGRVKVTNSGKSDIKALSFATKGKRVLVNDRLPQQKKIAADIIFWFDLSVNESKLIRVID
jgi:hypothetical protein